MNEVNSPVYDALSYLVNAKTLVLNNNACKTIPKSLLSVQNLTELYLENNGTYSIQNNNKMMIMIIDFYSTNLKLNDLIFFFKKKKKKKKNIC